MRTIGANEIARIFFFRRTTACKSDFITYQLVFYLLYTFLYFQIFVSLVNGRPGINRPSPVLLVRFLLYRDDMIKILTLF